MEPDNRGITKSAHHLVRIAQPIDRLSEVTICLLHRSFVKRQTRSQKQASPRAVRRNRPPTIKPGRPRKFSSAGARSTRKRPPEMRGVKSGAPANRTRRAPHRKSNFQSGSVTQKYFVTGRNKPNGARLPRSADEVPCEHSAAGLRHRVAKCYVRTPPTQSSPGPLDH